MTDEKDDQWQAVCIAVRIHKSDH